MRRLLLAAIMLFGAGLACQVDTGGVQATADALKNTLVSAFTEVVPTMGGVLTKATATPQSRNGTISGHLIYPSEYIPAMRVAAFNDATLAVVATVDTVEGQNAYSLSVPAGTYFVVAYTLVGDLAGGYSQMVPCGLDVSCTDHSLIPVTVAAGGSAGGINPDDWYAPAGSFPAKP
jgi:hypothetical protein